MQDTILAAGRTSVPSASGAPTFTTGTSSLGHKPQTEADGSISRWQFDESVTACFSDMLRRSIPDYDAMRRITTDMAEHYRRDDTHIVDLGASRGDGVADLIRRYASRNTFTLVETSQPMLDALRDRFRGYVDARRVQVLDLDLRETYPRTEASVTLCILTLQFTPIEHRQAILRRIYQHTRMGGALIIAEKVLGSSSEMQDLLVARYHLHKSQAGYSWEEIGAKARSLEGSLVPVSAAANEALLKGAGFQHVECVWRSLSFAAWVAVKATHGCHTRPSW